MKRCTILVMTLLLGLAAAQRKEGSKRRLDKQIDFENNPPCAASFCEAKGTSCNEAFGFNFFPENQLTKVTSHHCYLPGSREAGEQLYCCDTDSEDKKIISQLAVPPNEFPYMVSISSDKGNCGASVYNSEYIITAAHCVQDMKNPKEKVKGSFLKGKTVNAEKVTVKLATNINLFNFGSHDPEKVYTASGKNVRVHPKYHPNSLKTLYDVAVLKLDTPIKEELLDSGLVQSIRFPDAGEEPSTKRVYGEQYGRAIAIGFGKSDLNETLGALMGGILPLSFPKDKDCSESVGSDPVSIKQNLCIGGMGYGSVSSGDSGGPLLCYDKNEKPYQCGIASFVRGCIVQDAVLCPRIRPGVYVNTAEPELNEWILKQTKSSEQDHLMKKLKNDMNKPAGAKPSPTGTSMLNANPLALTGSTSNSGSANARRGSSRLGNMW